ncbi:serine carboxypeptidase-like 17 [Camellia sinensis]|uniref:serine carboxypeptidase-like 17 n=1 Tax=Camellia sinensis TaxID=4442 RepID=UPI001035A8DC|nr:serine carboxypeptidase-like 17 [Camellia sinensis]
MGLCPLNFEANQKEGSLPTLVLNPYSWTKVASVIFIDLPVGTGFSYGMTSLASQSSDLQSCDQAYEFLKKWLIDHPNFLSNPVYVGGESYTGITIPIIVQLISNGNEVGIKPLINLKGYLLGNPVTTPDDSNYAIPFAHGMGLISDELYESLQRSCQGEYSNIDPNNTRCLQDHQAYSQCIDGVLKSQILEPSCGFASPKPQELFSERRYVDEKNIELVVRQSSPCDSSRINAYKLSYIWNNNDRVREALHIRKLLLQVLNPNSWTKVASVIFIDLPVGTGFSYGMTSLASQSSDLQSCDQAYEFLKKWLIDHPNFLSNPVYVGGESYTGITIPIIVQVISNGNEAGIKPLINLKGYLLGNPVTTPDDSNYAIPFAHGMGLISDELYESLQRSCQGEYSNIDPNNTRCLQDHQAYSQCIDGVLKSQILEPSCGFASPKPQELFSERRYVDEKNIELVVRQSSPCDSSRINAYKLSYIWNNNDRVREALHIRKGSIKGWMRCNKLSYTRTIWDSFQYHVNLSTKGYRSLIYSGDHDMMVPFLGTQAWIRALNYSIVDEWRSWWVQGQVAGYTRTYSNWMTFATVKGGGHTASEQKPIECYTMFERWISNQPL